MSLLIICNPYYARIRLPYTDRRLAAPFEIDGQKFETKSGIGTYQFKVLENPGTYFKNGNFVVMNYDGQVQKIPFKIEYEVLEKK